MSAKPWTDGEDPTPEQFTDWFITQPRKDRIAMTERMLDAAARAYQCFVMDHEGHIEQVKLAMAARAAAWREGHAAGRDYQADGWNADAHDPDRDNPYRTEEDA